MQRKPDSIIRLALIVGDAIALIASFAVAYFIRAHVVPNVYFETDLSGFVLSIVLLVPVLIVILAALGLYKKQVFLGRSRLPELGKIFLASVLSIAALITYSFFAETNIFPVRLIAFFAVWLSFAFLLIERYLIRFVARQIFRKAYGARRVLIVGNNANTDYLASYIAGFPECGYQLAGIIANRRYIPKDLKTRQYSSLKEALKKARADVIFQTDEKSTEYVYKQAVARHLLYYFVPSETALSSHFGEIELIGNTPAVMVKLTPLSGGAAAVKRFFDILFSLVGIVLGAIPMLLTWIAIKLSDIKHSPIYADERLTRYNHKFKCYKFRSMKSEYSGMPAEEAFIKMGKPELIKKYRKNGDYMKNDPRITRIGRFIRATSLDELPQLFNILKGDISLIGPRALLPGELRGYGDRSLILSVKSGLTGFAQVSGRRDIPFEERRMLDIYYVKNWSLLLDLQIFFKTILVVIRGDGAK